MATGTRKPPKQKKKKPAAKKKAAKKSNQKPKSEKMKIGAVVINATKYIAAAGGIVAVSVAATSAIESKSKSGKPLHPAARAGVSLAATLLAAFVAVKLKKPAFAATIITAGTVKAGVDAMPIFEDAGQKIADKAQKALKGKPKEGEEGGGKAVSGIARNRLASPDGMRDLVN